MKISVYFSRNPIIAIYHFIFCRPYLPTLLLTSPLIACTDSSTTVNIEGSAAKGLLRNSYFTMQRLDTTEELFNTVLLNTDENGRFESPFGSFAHISIKPPESFHVFIDNNAFGGANFRIATITCDYLDGCPRGGTRLDNFGDETPLVGFQTIAGQEIELMLRSYFIRVGGPKNYFAEGIEDGRARANISVLTTLAAAVADNIAIEAGSETTLPDHMDEAQTRLQSLLQLDNRGIDIYATELIDITDADAWRSASEPERYHSVLNAAIIGAVKTFQLSERNIIGLPPLSESYAETLSRLAADLTFNGEFGGDGAAFHYAGNYDIQVEALSIGLAVSFNADVDDQGYLSASNQLDATTFDLLDLRVSFEGIGQISGIFTSNATLVNGLPAQAFVGATIAADGRITGTLTASNFVGSVTGSAALTANNNFNPNTNSGISPAQLLTLADQQYQSLNILYQTLD